MRRRSRRYGKQSIMGAAGGLCGVAYITLQNINVLFDLREMAIGYYVSSLSQPAFPSLCLMHCCATSAALLLLLLLLRLPPLLILLPSLVTRWWRSTESGQQGGGEGGAVYTALGAVTTFRRKANFRKNRCGSTGGAVHSVGITTLQGSGIFYGNSASVSHETVWQGCELTGHANDKSPTSCCRSVRKYKQHFYFNT